jgi:hypothetical protein
MSSLINELVKNCVESNPTRLDAETELYKYMIKENLVQIGTTKTNFEGYSILNYAILNKDEKYDPLNTLKYTNLESNLLKAGFNAAVILQSFDNLVKFSIEFKFYKNNDTALSNTTFAIANYGSNIQLCTLLCFDKNSLHFKTLESLKARLLMIRLIVLQHLKKFNKMEKYTTEKAAVMNQFDLASFANGKAEAAALQLIIHTNVEKQKSSGGRRRRW